MNRCPDHFSPSRRALALTASRLGAAALLASVVTASLPAIAQGLPSTDTRNFPPAALFGELAITAFPEVAINGQAIRTTPGFRLFSPERSIVFAHNYAGKKMLVGYVIEPQTQALHTAWILTPAEIEKYKPIQPRTGLMRIFGS